MTPTVLVRIPIVIVDEYYDIIISDEKSDGEFKE